MAAGTGPWTHHSGRHRGSLTLPKKCLSPVNLRLKVNHGVSTQKIGALPPRSEGNSGWESWESGGRRRPLSTRHQPLTAARSLAFCLRYCLMWGFFPLAGTPFIFPSLFTENILLPILKPPIILGLFILWKTLKVNRDDGHQEEEVDGLNFSGLKFKANCLESVQSCSAAA